MGRDKASLEIDGTPMLARVLAALAPVVDIRVVAASPGQALPLLPAGAIVVHDHVLHPGPLPALAHGLRALPPDVELAFVCGADIPWLVSAVVERMFALAERGPPADLLLLERDGLQLLGAVYATALASRMSALINGGEASLKALAREAATRVVRVVDLLADPRVAIADPLLHSFDDVDSPADLARYAPPK